MCACVRVSVCECECVFVCVSVCVMCESVFVSVCLSVCLSVCVCARVSVCVRAVFKRLVLLSCTYKCQCLTADCNDRYTSAFQYSIGILAIKL